MIPCGGDVRLEADARGFETCSDQRASNSERDRDAASSELRRVRENPRKTLGAKRDDVPRR